MSIVAQGSSPPVSASAPAVAAPKRSSGWKTDTLAVGMVMMLLMTIVGRGIGFFRGMAFCRLMDDADVGRWSMAFGFFTLITPVMLLGIPGALPRFTEHYRRRGSLTAFVRRTIWATVLCTLTSVVAMLVWKDWFSWIIFLQPAHVGLINALIASVVGMIAYNFVCDLCTSLRRVRVVSVMQFIQGVGFTVLSITWLMWAGPFEGVVWMFAASCGLAILPGIFTLITGWQAAAMVDQDATSPSDPVASWTFGSMVRRLAPYAAALWMMNLIGNCFELSDRYMILHFMPDEGLGKTLSGQSAVGQYHSGRIIPMLLLSLGTMIGGVMMPYLAADWESKRVESIQTRLRDALLAVSVVFTCGSAVAIWLGPWIFGSLLQGRYSDGLSLMPMALCFCTWSALVTIGQNYLWTVERGKWVPIAMGVGLICNIVLNVALLPTFGLSGAVLATMLSHGIVMAGVWIAMVACGYQLDRWLIALSILPGALLVAPWFALVAALATSVIWLLDAESRSRLRYAWR
ncbi:MAG: lipopolysaccharide biosynthesis protein [Planctomycetota bacterium]